MSLPPKAVPKSAAAVGSGPGTGPSPSSQLRATLTTVPLPGPPVAQQPPAVPPTQVFLNALHPRIPRVQPPLEDRIFPTQPGVTAVYSKGRVNEFICYLPPAMCVQRPPGPPYTAHEIGKAHPNLAATPPGHASSPGLSQVSVSTVSTAHLYGHPKGWEAGGGSPYSSGQNAGTNPLVYSPSTQPMNAQPQSRPFAPGPRPTHHQGGFRPIQFFQRTQMQTARPTIPSNNPSIRPASQTPTATVYPSNQPIMMTMTAMPFPSPQTPHQYYIPQYRHGTPYVGAPQQYSVQPTGPSTFYTGPSPGEFPTPYAGPPYYPGQPVYTPSQPIIVPTPQQPPPAKREKKTIRIRDPNQGGKDITEEIMSGVGGSSNPTHLSGPHLPPHPLGSPAGPVLTLGSVKGTHYCVFLCPHPHYPHIFYLKSQQLGSQVADHGPVVYNVDAAAAATSSAPAAALGPAPPVDFKPDDKPKLEAVTLKPSSPGLRPPDPPSERSGPVPPHEPSTSPSPSASAPVPVTTTITFSSSDKPELPACSPEAGPSSSSSSSSVTPATAPGLTLMAKPEAAAQTLPEPAPRSEEPRPAPVAPSSTLQRTPQPEAVPSLSPSPSPSPADLSPVSPAVSPAPSAAMTAVNGLAEADSASSAAPIAATTTTTTTTTTTIPTTTAVSAAADAAASAAAVPSASSPCNSSSPQPSSEPPQLPSLPQLSQTSPAQLAPKPESGLSAARTPREPDATATAAAATPVVPKETPEAAAVEPPAVAMVPAPTISSTSTSTSIIITAAVAAPVAAGPPPVPALAPPPGLQHPPGLPVPQALVQAKRPTEGTEAPKAARVAEVTHEEKADAQQQLSRKSSNQATPSAPKTWKKPKEEPSAGSVPVRTERRKRRRVRPLWPWTTVPAAPVVVEENGERDPEPLRNGAEHTSETDSSDSGLTPGPRDGSGDPLPQLAEEDRKKQYDRDFLLGFQFMPACVQKPEGLPPISDVVLDKINQNKLPQRTVDPRVISRGPDFTPAFADFSRQVTGGRGAPLLNVGGLRRPPPRKIIMNVSVDDVQLKKAENAWKPGLKRETAAVVEDPDLSKTQELFRKVRSILNKLTPQMFNQLMKQVTELTIDTEERLKGVIDLVFEKAIDEPSFSVAYGNMCRCLATLKVPMADKPNSTVNFRKLLLNRCQKEFERDKVDDDVFEKKQKELEAAAMASERERLQEELEEAKDKARRRSIGNIKFIGELFKLKMLTEAIMHDCVVKLLKNHDEESLECLCRLLTTIGKDLDFEKAKPRMDQYFNQMEKIVKERKTSSRIRFMLQDVIDLRLHNWVSRRADQGPKTIEQIHKDAKIEEQEEQRKNSLRPHRVPAESRAESRAVQREETWNTVPMTKNSRTIDPSKIPKISKPTIDDKIQLGPRAGALNWMKGSSGGAGAKASESDASRSSGSSLNRYSALQSSSSQAPSSPSTPSDFDSRRSLSSRGSSGRERNDKPASSTPSRPGSFSLASGGKEPSEELSQEEPRREAPDTPKLQGSAQDKAKPERSRSRDSVKLEAPAALSPEKPALSEEEMERRCKAIIDEFLHINDYKEAVQCVEELEQASQLHMFVRVGVESTLERSQSTRDHMGQLFFQLVQAGTLSKLHFCQGFSDTLELADDMAIDIPHIWLYLAELVNPMFREGGISMRELFSEFSKPLLPVGRAGILFSEILHLLCKQMSHRKVGALWRESGLIWADFLPEGSDVHSFIAEQKLEFTLSDSLSLNEAPSKRTLSPEELNKHLEKLLLEDAAGDEQIFDWVEANLDEAEMSSPPFLRALMTAVCKAAVKWDASSCRVDTAIIQKRLPVLLKYLNSDTERQLQALYALQALIVKLDQPPNLLRMFFDCLYDEDVISEDAFYKWESSKDPSEQQGKGVALKSVTAFFTWLREAEEESEDN
ncbi:hypothetical protein AALO_G00053560 [Alosa alosa]|uniref:Eukaryotic translation initiation factor 4 gamma 3 n=1 Tax=Alosa alosa TaxID=278164 RepID=A0AAV6H9F7_9TELE|nr:hypothetical protein AALO_G00053560 [Alosa alosa]